MVEKGISRAIDALGRIVIPGEMRRALDLHPGSYLDIMREGDTIILKEETHHCIFCKETKEDSFFFEGKNVCFDCLEKLTSKKPSEE